MKVSKLTILLILLSTVCVSLYIGFNFKRIILYSILTNINLSNIDTEDARKLATDILDAASIPDGDIALPSNKASSKRYIVSKWQRAAVGSSIVIFGKDPFGNLCVVLGKQRGLLRNPQGYMEVALPKTDLTGMKQLHATRRHNKTLVLVAEDLSTEDNAVREIYEETGLTIHKSNLILLGITYSSINDPVSFAVQYMATLSHTPELSTKDEEFVADDLQSPEWVKLSDIRYNIDSKSYFSQTNNITLEESTIRIINLGLKKLSMKEIRSNAHKKLADIN